MRLLRANKDSLMSVLDAFIHDPLVEWEDEKRKSVRPHLQRDAYLDLKISLGTGEERCQAQGLAYSWTKSFRVD